MRKYSKRTIAAGTVGAVAVSGIAYAFWTSSGSGEGTATTASDASPVTIVQTSSVTNLAPGAPAQALSGTITNPNQAPVFIGGISASLTVVPLTGQTCSVDDYTLVQPGRVDKEVAVDDTTTWGGGSIAFNNKPSVDQNGCKGATVRIAYTVTS